MRLYHGIVEDVNDPMGADRVRVRVYELHTDIKSSIPTEALPWAHVMGDTKDASMTGVGHSGSGLVCGSWVILYFMDSDEQYPVVLGTLKGIPADPSKTTPGDIKESVFADAVTPSVVQDSSGNSVVSSDGKPVTTGVTQTTSEPVMAGARRASDFKSIGERGIMLIKGSEGFRPVAYQDQGGIWTIGYGTTYYPNGNPVQQGDTITRQYAAEIFALDVNTKFLPIVHKIVTVPVTQEMVDALVSLVYNLGSLKKSSNLITDLNSGKYELAASRFLDYNKAKIRGVLTVVPGLTTRREREKNLFLSGGIPTELGGIEEFPLEPEPPRDIPLSPLPEFDTETETNRKLASRGFADPKAKYPLYRNEPDTHRLARHAKISETVVYRKEISRDMDVPIAGTTKTWSQSPIPYNARYPNNKVQASESGHLFEFDDTDNSRRIHLYHAAGTFMEIDDNGTEVKRIVGDGYEIIDRNGFIHVKGALHVAVDGVHTLKVSGACNVDISGSTVINVFNDAKLNISGNMETSVAGDYRILVGGEYSVDASRIDLNSGKGSGLTKPKPKVTPDEIEFSELTVLTRGNESAMQYETPDESGELTAYTNTRIETGEATKEDYSKPTEEKDKESVTGTMTNTYPTPDGIPAGCSEIDAMTSYPPHYQLSRHFTIGSFTQNGTRPIVAQMGLKPNQIACALKTLAGCLDLVKDMFPHMIITSGFRRPGDVANSSKTSKHYNGEAADVQLPGYSRKEYKEAVKKITQMFPFDQVILEYQGNTTWIHIGVSKSSQRGQIFTMNNHKRIGEMGELVVLA